MKKLALFLACASLLTTGAYAQKRTVDEVKKAIGGMSVDANAFRNAMNQIQPALTNDETKGQAETWVVAGKCGFGAYDKMNADAMIGKGSDSKAMSEALFKGFEYYKKALELDPVAEVDKKTGEPKRDKNGNIKYKTKYTNEICNQLAGHINDFTNVAAIAYNDNQDYKTAYKAWDMYTQIGGGKLIGKATPQLADTIVGQMCFYKGVAAMQSQMYKEALDAFNEARTFNYKNKDVYDYAMGCAAALKDDAAVVAIAEEALPVYGDKDSQYIGIIINNAINHKDFAKANQLLDQAIAANPNNCEYYDIKGVLVENEKNIEEALPFFKKAIEINPDYAQGLFDVGRYYYNKAAEVVKSNPDLSGKALEAKVFPLYNEALPYLRKAYDLDKAAGKQNNEAKNALKSIYYAIGDETNLNQLDNE